jgi:hypothetical protein
MLLLTLYMTDNWHNTEFSKHILTPLKKILDFCVIISSILIHFENK